MTIFRGGREKQGPLILIYTFLWFRILHELTFTHKKVISHSEKRKSVCVWSRQCDLHLYVLLLSCWRILAVLADKYVIFAIHHPQSILCGFVSFSLQ